MCFSMRIACAAVLLSAATSLAAVAQTLTTLVQFSGHNLSLIHI